MLQAIYFAADDLPYAIDILADQLRSVAENEDTPTSTQIWTTYAAHTVGAIAAVKARGLADLLELLRIKTSAAQTSEEEVITQ